jgi:hypothetical protein
MRTFTLIILGSIILVGCSENREVTKQQVIDAFCKIEGKERAETSYARAMAEVRPKCPDDATANRQILDSIQQAGKIVAGWKKSVDETKDKLLHKTDHQGVLAASREVIRTRRDLQRDPNDPKIAPDNPKLPEVIRKLNASSIFVDEDSLNIVFGGAIHHQGFIAYSESFTNSTIAADGFQKVIDGLGFIEDTK